MTFQTIIFDFDGVLFDSERIHYTACNQALKSLGLIISENDYFTRYIGLSDYEIFQIILPENNVQLTTDDMRKLIQLKSSVFIDTISYSPTLDAVKGVKQFIERFVNQFSSFAICSGAMREELESVLKRLENGELKKYFKHIITFNDVSKGKPSPEGYLLAAERLNILPHHCLVIEDTPVGIHAAKSAGMSVVGIATTHQKAILKEANFVAENYEEIADWLVKA